MPTQVLQPGAVTLADNFNTYIPYTIAGDPPQWADGSDATYSETWHSVRSGEAKGDIPIAPLDVLDIGAATVTAITLDARVAWENRDGASRRLVDFEIRDSSGNAVVGFAPTGYDLPDVAGPSDITLNAQVDLWGTNLAAVAATLTAGANVAAYRFTASGDTIPADYGLTVYELSITVAYSGVARTLQAPPRRLSQRDDGLFGGAPRLTGKRSAQASNRLLGGYL